ncbi:MAG TPA: SGNH/GDSL hydrolase family protein [Candidatus Acidoferrales bacterium]|nr:SGNH/GDSL hydrolase family protein [Candidatus Acidoferrales bacterium]
MRPLLILAAAVRLLAQTPEPLSSDAAGVFAIWPGPAPGSESWKWMEQIDNRGGTRMARNVVTPTLTMYKPAAGKANGSSVIIAPGGAFRFLMVDYEGVDMARWLAQRGVTAFVLRYRVMHTPEDDAAMNAFLQDLMKTLSANDTRGENPPAYSPAELAVMPLAEEDGGQAIRYVRGHAAEWGLDPHRIGIAGFSAGGGVTMGPVMQHDASSRPDFAAPIYPAYRTATPVPADAPPLFIAMADDDRLISPGSAARLYTAWHAAGKPAELHIFRRGNHGFGMRTQNLPSDGWINLFLAWMESSGFLKPAAQPIGRLYVFGDSYSDTGAGYEDGDGPTAVAYLARRLGFELRPANDPGGGSQSLNFAVSGAQTGHGAGRKVQDALLGRGMQEQVDDFAARVGAKQIVFDPERTLFFLAGGLNDRRLPGAETVANLEGHVRRLYALGARRFRIALMPEAIPSFSEVGRRLNPELRRIPGDMQSALPGAQIELSNWGPFFDEVLRNPAAYGIENTTDKCAGRAIFGEDATPCARPSAYYYYHAGHPSTAVHRAVGDMLYKEITN